MTETHPAGDRYYADVPSRAFAHLVDAIVVSLAAFVVAVVVSAVLGPVVHFHTGASGVRDHITINTTRAAIDGVLTTLVGVAYFALSWRARGATLGQRLLGIEVRRNNGAPVGMGAAVVRWVLLLVPVSLASVAISAQSMVGTIVVVLAILWYAVLCLTAARNARKRGVHDRIASTIVTKMGRRVDV